MPPAVALAGARVAGFIAKDALLTREQLDDLRAELLVSEEPPRGTVRSATGCRDGRRSSAVVASARTRHQPRLAPLHEKQHVTAPIDVVTAPSATRSLRRRKLLERGRGVRTLTNHPRLDPRSGHAIPSLTRWTSRTVPRWLTALTGTDTLYNTYWVRAPHGSLNAQRRRSRTPGLDRCCPPSRCPAHRPDQHCQPDGINHQLLPRQGRARRGRLLLGPLLRDRRPTLLFGEGDVLIITSHGSCGIFRLCDPRRRPLPPATDARQRSRGAAVEVGSQPADVIVDSAGPRSLPLTNWCICFGVR